MGNSVAGKKIIAVSDEAVRESYFLSLILSRCGRNLYSAASESRVLSSSREAAALLSPNPAETPDPVSFPVLVTKYRSDGGTASCEGSRKTVTYAVDCDGANFTARNVRPMAGGITAFEIVGVGVIGRVRLKTGDRNDAEASLAAAAAAIAAGLPFAAALDALNGSGQIAPRAE